ncbi:glycosyltransferase family 2 protein [Paenibacillus sp. GCM10027627]|uniref:glycosyltransferase family 2 protein n=1 Tax=unclassified Paenibacillus TaxID=185978 RepID=UPI00363FF609
MNEQPLISIIMPAYNRGGVISEAIRSVIEQTYDNWELIVIDDRSTDRTKEIVEAFSVSDSRIRYVLNDRAKGPGGARNCGMLAAKGEKLAFLDSDDIWFPFHLRDSLHTLATSGAEISFALWVERHGENVIHNFDNKVEQKWLAKMRTINSVSGEAIVYNDRLFEQFLSHTRNFFQLNTMIFPRKLLDEVGLINEEFYLGEDTTFLIRFFDRYKIALITKPHSVYTLSPDSVYFFCDRWKLDPDSLYQNKELMDKFEALGLKSVKVRTHLRTLVEQSERFAGKERCIRNINMGISCKYFTLSYLHRLDREKAIHYCRLSLQNKVTLFNLLLMMRLMLSIKGGNGLLRKGIDLW